MAFRRRAVVASATAAMLVLTACGHSSSKSSVPKTITGAAASSVVPWAASGKEAASSITICEFAGPELDSLRKLAPQFTKLSGGKISVKFVPIPTESSNQGTLDQLRSKSSSCDLVDQSSTNAGLINQYLEPLTSYMKQPSLLNSSVYNLNDFSAGLRALSTYNGALVSLPYGSDSPLLMYRADLMKQWGITVPVAPKAWSWTDLLTAIKTIQPKLKAAGMQFPIAVGGVNSISGAIFALQAMWSFGGNPLLGTTKFNFTDPSTVKGLASSVALVHTLHAASPGTSTYDYTELQQALESGRVPMAIEWNAAAADLDNPKVSPKTAGKMGYAMVPYGTTNPNQPRTFLSTHALAMNKSSKNKDAAFEFMAWYTSSGPAKQYVASGADSSGRTSLLTNAAFAQSQPQLKPLGFSLAVAHSLPAGPYLPDVLTSVIGPNSNAAYAGTASAASAVGKMQTAAESLVKKAGH